MNKLRNKYGRVGLGILLLILVLAIVVFLSVTNLSSLGVDNTTQQEENHVQQAQDAVNAINQKQQEAEQVP